MKRKEDRRKQWRVQRITGALFSVLLFCAAVLCIVTGVRRYTQIQGENEPDVVASRCENNKYDLIVAANCDEITDAEAFAEEVVRKYEENSFYTTKLSVDLGEKIDLVCFHVYLKREDIGKKEELFQIHYQDGDIILDGIAGKR